MPRHYLSLSLSAIALSLSAGAASAQEAGDRPFDGFYVGGTLGYDVQPNDVGSTILFDKNLDGMFGDTVSTAAGANAFSPGFCNGSARTALPADGCDNDKDGIGYSGRVGYDRQFGHAVLGIVGEFGKAEISDSVSAFSTTPARYTMTRKLDYDASLRLRAGYAANTTLFYATGGVAYARVKSSFSTSNTANSFAGSGKRDAWGYTAGGGIEQKISRNFSIGLEYRYNQVKDDGYRIRVGAGTAPATNPFILAPNTTGTDFRRSDDKFRWHSLRATAAFRF